jgi:hypothetical protein
LLMPAGTAVSQQSGMHWHPAVPAVPVVYFCAACSSEGLSFKTDSWFSTSCRMCACCI